MTDTSRISLVSSLDDIAALAGQLRVDAIRMSTGAGSGIVDVNEFGMRGPTALGWDLQQYAARVRAFGCRALVVDGHDIESIDAALRDARADRRPTVVLARTLNGRGVAEVEEQAGWRGRTLPRDMAARAISVLGGERDLHIRPNPPAAAPTPSLFVPRIRLPEFPVGEPVATRTAYGQTLAALGEDPRVVVVDAEVGNCTCAELFESRYPARYFDVFAAEQQMIAAAVGLGVRGYVPFAATFAAFLTRAHDFIRRAAVSAANIRLVGSHAGVEAGPDGPSQVALEDLAVMRSVHGSTVLYPSDSNSTARLTEATRALPGISYLRTTHVADPVLHDADESFPIPGSKVLRASPCDQVTLIGAGVTVHVAHLAVRNQPGSGRTDELMHEAGIPPVQIANAATGLLDVRPRSRTERR